MTEGEPGSEANRDALISVITALTAAVRDLTAVLERGAVVVSAAPAPSAAHRTSGVTAPVAATSAAPAPVSASGSVMEQVSSVIAEVFRLAGQADDDLAFEAFVALNHSERISAPRAIPSLREFAWRQLRKRWADYLRVGDDPSSFTVARTDPARVDSGASSVRVFLQAKGRSQTPVALKRDAAADGAFRLTDSSL